MRRGGVGIGVFSGDFDPPSPWRLFGIKLRQPTRNRRSTEKTIGALSSEELKWVARTVIAEIEARQKCKGKASL